jgi:transcriptional regulator with XRE-family HTH domain
MDNKEDINNIDTQKAYYVNVAKRLKELRLAKGLTTKEAADMLDVSEQQYLNYETATYTTREEMIPTTSIAKMAVVYNVSFSYMAGLSDSKVSSTTNPPKPGTLDSIVDIISAKTRMDFKLMQNKVVLLSLLVGLLLYTALGFSKFLPVSITSHIHHLNSALWQSSILAILVMVLVSAFLNVSFLTYIAAFWGIRSIIGIIYIIFFTPLSHPTSSKIDRAILYLVVLVLTIAYVQWLKRVKNKHMKMGKN